MSNQNLHFKYFPSETNSKHPFYFILIPNTPCVKSKKIFWLEQIFLLNQNLYWMSQKCGERIKLFLGKKSKGYPQPKVGKSREISGMCSQKGQKQFFHLSFITSTIILHLQNYQNIYYTVCPRNSYPTLYSELLFKLGQDFLGIHKVLSYFLIF